MPNSITTGDLTFTREDDKPSGKKVEQVAKMISRLRSAQGTPVSFEELCEEAEVKYPQDVQAAMIALELIEQIDRYVYVTDGSTRQRVGYGWAEGKSSPSSPASSARSRKRSSAQAKKDHKEEVKAAA